MIFGIIEKALMVETTPETGILQNRSKWLGWFVAVLFFVFAARLAYLQIIRHEYYVTLARANQVSKNTINPVRGTIYARDGSGSSAATVPLVMNETVYTVFADPSQIKDASKIESTIKQIAGGEAVNQSFQYLRDSSKQYLVLARQVTRTQAQKIQEADLEGVGLQQGSRRVYPEGQLASQLLGYVNREGEGQYGIEELLNERLTGTPGLLQSVTDVRRIPLTIGSGTVDIPAVNGDNIVLSIDRNVQVQLEQVLKTHFDKVRPANASGIIMDPSTGRIVAMANYPTYDPANYSSVTDYRQFQNYTTDNAYEPGSVMKVLTVGAGLNEQVVTPTSTFNNTGGCTTVADATICNVVRTVPSSPTTQQLLTYSLNTGAVNVLRQLGGGMINRSGREKLYDYFSNHYRFGKTTGVEQPSEAAGVIYSPNDEEGNDVRYANMTFGQGITATMVQVASAFSATINGGTYYKPTLVYGSQKSDGVVEEQAPVIVQQNVIGADYSAQLRDMVWHTRYDSAVGKADPAGYHIGGKSGTSETIDPATGAYTSDKTIGSYMGFVGGSSGVPRYVIMIRMDYAEGRTFAGSIEANSTFGDLARWLLPYVGITPN